MNQITSVRGIRRSELPSVAVPRIDMSTQIGSLMMPSPVLTAAGCAGNSKELDGFVDLAAIGAVTTRSVTMRARAGTPTPRAVETPSGMVSAIGLHGPGLDRFIDRDLAWLEQRGARIIVSIAGSTIDEFAKVAQRLRSVGGFDAVEVNLDCPNPDGSGAAFGADPEAAAAVVQAVRRHTDTRVPTIGKLIPDVTDIVAVARAVQRAGADALTLIHAPGGMVIDVDRMRPGLGGIVGSLSGPAIRPIALRCVWQVRAALPDLPIIGTGGIRTGLDALQFVMAGAHAVAIGTSIFGDPSSPMRIHRELAVALHERGFASLGDAIGIAHRSVRREPEPDPQA